jgi:hypothetical protein
MNGIGKAIDHRLKLGGHAVDVHWRPEHDASALSILSTNSVRLSA